MNESDIANFAKIKGIELKSRINDQNSLGSRVFLAMFNEMVCIAKFTSNIRKAKREHFWLQKLAGMYPCPRAIALFHDRKGSCLLMTEIEGQTLTAEDFSNSLARKAGKLLAQLHAIPVENFSDMDEEKTSAGQLLNEYFERSLSECHHLGDNWIGRVKNRFEEDFSRVVSFLSGPCIVHRDYRPGNLLVRERKITGVIDFENTLQGFPEEDFALMQALVWDENPTTKEDFINGYTTIRKLPCLERVMPFLLFCKSLGVLGVTSSSKDNNEIHRDVHERNLRSVNRYLNARG